MQREHAHLLSREIHAPTTKILTNSTRWSHGPNNLLFSLFGPYPKRTAPKQCKRFGLAAQTYCLARSASIIINPSKILNLLLYFLPNNVKKKMLIEVNAWECYDGINISNNSSNSNMKNKFRVNLFLVLALVIFL